MLRAFVRRASGVAPLLAARVAGAGVTGGLAIYVARTQGVEYSGKFFVFISTITIMSVLTRLGADPYLSSQVAPRAAGGPDVTARYLVATLAAVGALVVAAGAVLAGAQLFAGNLAEILLGGNSVHLVVLAVAGLNMVWVVGAYCRAMGMAATSIFLETGLFSAWLMVILEGSRRAASVITPNQIALGVFLLCPVLLIPLTPVVYRARRALPGVRDIKDALVGVVTFGAVTVTNGIVILVPLQVLGWFGSNHDAGVYNAALRVSMFVGAFGVVIRTLVVKKTAQRSNGAENRVGDVKQSVLVALPWILVSLVISWQGQRLASLFGPGFSELHSIILVMLVAQCVYVAGNLIETRAVLAGEKVLLNVTSVTTIIVAFCVTVPLVDAFGLQGAVWGFALTIGVSRAQLVLLYLRAPVRRAVGREAAEALPDLNL